MRSCWRKTVATRRDALIEEVKRLALAVEELKAWVRLADHTEDAGGNPCLAYINEMPGTHETYWPCICGKYALVGEDPTFGEVLGGRSYADCTKCGHKMQYHYKKMGTLRCSPCHDTRGPCR